MSKKARERSLSDTEAKAVARMLRVSPQKLNLLAQLIRGKKVAAALADLAAERRQLTALELQTVLRHLGPQRGRDVVGEKAPHLGQPGPLLVVELEVHNGDISR